MNRRLDAFRKPAVMAASAWLVGLVAFTVLGVESLFAEPHAAFVYARLTAYIASMTVAALTLGLAALFGLGCGMMLWWLDDAADAGRIAACVGQSFWSVVGYTWIGLALLVAEPPPAVAIADLAQPDLVSAQIGDVLAYAWLDQMRWIAIGVFLGAMIWLLARTAKLVNAALAVAFGAGLVAASLTVLGVLGGGEDF